MNAPHESVRFALKLEAGAAAWSPTTTWARGETVRPIKVTEATGRSLLNSTDTQAADIIDGITQEHTVDGYTSWPALAVSLETALRALRTEARKMVPPGQDWEWLEADGVGFYCQLGRGEDEPTISGVWIDGAWRFPEDVLAKGLADKLCAEAEEWLRSGGLL